MQILNAVLAILIIFLISRILKSNHIVISIIAALNIFIICTTLLGVILLVFQHYSMLSSQIILLVIVLLLTAFNIEFEIPDITFTKKEVFIFLASLTVLLITTFQRVEYFEQNGDAGVYTNYAITLINGGQLNFKNEIASLLPSNLKLLYYSNNLIPGTYVDHNLNTYYFQFYKGWPVGMANFGSIFGLTNVQYVMVPLYLLMITNIFLIICYKVKNKACGFIALVVFSTSPLLVYFSKYPTSELFILYILVLCIFLICMSGKQWNIMAGLGMILISFTHIQNFFFIPIFFLAIIYAYIKKNKNIVISISMGLFGIILSIPYGFHVSYQYFISIYTGTFHSIKVGIVVVTVISLSGILLCNKKVFNYLLRKRIICVVLRLIDSIKLNVILSRICIIVLALATVFIAYQLGWTNKYMPDTVNNYNNWSVHRPSYVNTGLHALPHLNLVSICLSSVLIVIPIILIVYFFSKNIHEKRLSSFTFYSLIIQLMVYTIIRPDTTINYYASRYYLLIILPNIILVLYFALDYLSIYYKRIQKTLSIALLVLIACFNMPYDIFMTVNQDYGGRLQFIETVANEVPDHSILFVKSGDISEYLLATYMKATKNTSVIAVSSKQALEEIGQYLDSLDKLNGYYLTTESFGNGENLVNILKFNSSDYVDSIFYPLHVSKNSKAYNLYSIKSIDISQYIDEKYVLGSPLYFNSSQKNYSNYLVTGLSGSEEKFTWSNEKEVKFAFDCGQVINDLQLDVALAPFLYDGITKQNVDVVVNNQPISSWEVNKSDKYSVNIPSELVFSGKIDLTFIISDPKSPKTVGQSNDARLLGIRFYEMSIN